MSSHHMLSAVARVSGRHPSTSSFAARSLVNTTTSTHRGALPPFPATRPQHQSHTATDAAHLRQTARLHTTSLAERRPTLEVIDLPIFESQGPLPTSEELESALREARAIAGSYSNGAHRRPFTETFDEQDVDDLIRAESERSRKRARVRVHVDDKGSPRLMHTRPASASIASRAAAASVAVAGRLRYDPVREAAEEEFGTRLQRAIAETHRNGREARRLRSPRSRRSVGILRGSPFLPGTITVQGSVVPEDVVARVSGPGPVVPGAALAPATIRVVSPSPPAPVVSPPAPIPVAVGPVVGSSPAAPILVDSIEGSVAAVAVKVEPTNGNDISSSSNANKSKVGFDPSYYIGRPSTHVAPLISAHRSPGTDPWPARSTFAQSPSPPPPASHMAFHEPLRREIESDPRACNAALAGSVTHLEMYSRVLKKARDAEQALREAGFDWLLIDDNAAVGDAGQGFPRQMHRLGYYHAHVSMAAGMRLELEAQRLGRYVEMIEEELGYRGPHE